MGSLILTRSIKQYFRQNTDLNHDGFTQFQPPLITVSIYPTTSHRPLGSDGQEPDIGRIHFARPAFS